MYDKRIVPLAVSVRSVEGGGRKPRSGTDGVGNAGTAPRSGRFTNEGTGKLTET